MWIVFEKSNASGDNSIYNYDAMKVFEEETEAIEYEMKNKKYRIRKYVPLPENMKLVITKKEIKTDPDAYRTIKVTKDMSEEDIKAAIDEKAKHPLGTMYISVKNNHDYDLLQFIDKVDTYDLHSEHGSYMQINSEHVAHIIYDDLH